MSSIAIEEFDAEWESTDDLGKRKRHPCRVVGITDDEQFIVIAKADNGRIGTFKIDTVFEPEHQPLRRIAR